MTSLSFYELVLQLPKSLQNGPLTEANTIALFTLSNTIISTLFTCRNISFQTS